MTEEDRLMRRINQRFMKGVMNYKLIEEGDCILVGLSGGKDSLALLELLARRSRIYKPKFSVVAAHVVMKNIAYESDQTYLREYAESLGVPYVCYETEFDPSTDTRKSPCFLCSWNRRKALFHCGQGAGLQQDCFGTSHGRHIGNSADEYDLSGSIQHHATTLSDA